MPVKKYQEFIPHATLQDVVKRFWILEKEYTGDDSIEEVTPDACVELIFNFGSPYIQNDSTRRELPKVCLIGLLSKPLRLEANGLVKIVAARFYAWGALPFFENAADANSATPVDIKRIWRQAVQRIAAHVETEEYSKAVEVIEDFLIGQRLKTLFDPERVRAAAKLLYHTKGQFRVAELESMPRKIRWWCISTMVDSRRWKYFPHLNTHPTNRWTRAAAACCVIIGPAMVE